MSGRLVVAAAPIGNVADASERLRTALGEADVIAAEDTRRLRRLAAALDVQIGGRVVSYFEGNEAERARELIEALDGGQTVLLVTDAGMPGVSDPGYRVVVAAAERGLTVTPLPGPSAVTAALAVAGLPSDRFCFEGFLPRRSSERRRRLDALAAESRTLVFFEAPHRLRVMIGDLAAAFGAERRAVACRELTKTYEEVRRGTLGDLAAWATAIEVRGEVTLVVAGADSAERQADPTDLATAVAAQESSGATRKAGIAAVAREFGVPKKTVYDAVVASGKRARPRH